MDFTLHENKNFEVIDEELQQLNINNCFEMKDNNIEERFDRFIIEECLDNNNCNHFIMFYTKDNKIHSCARMSKNYITELLKQYRLNLEHFKNDV